MKPMDALLVATLVLSGCAGNGEEATPAVEELGEELAAFAPCCGDGFKRYYEWKCRCTLVSCAWEMVQVGTQRLNCSYPFFGPVQGRTTDCSFKDAHECGGGDSCECVEFSCPPHPRTFCDIASQP
jgi:hypothetical protein